MSYYIDSHCHVLYRSNSKLELINNIKIAESFNIKKIFCIGDLDEKIEKLEWLQEISQENKNIFFSVGLHPTNLQNLQFDKMLTIYDKFKDSMLALGEIGLDGYKNPNSLEDQLRFLKEQINFAKIFNKPIIIHTRECEIDPILDLIRGTNLKFLFHCFTYNTVNLEKIINLGGFVGFAGMVTHKNNKNIYKNLDLIETVKNCPISQMLIETDMPFISPNSKRGQENRIEYIIETYKEISKIKSISISDLQLVMIKNMQNFYNITF